MGQNLSAEVFKPPDPPGYDETLPGLQYLEKDGRKVPYIFYKYEDSSEAKEGSELTEEPDPFRDHWTIMYFTDTATDMGVFGKWLKIMSTVLKVHVVSFDYYGYGQNHPGQTPSEKAAYEDVEAIFTYFTEVIGVPSEKIVLFGRSTGSGPLIHLCTTLRDRRKSLQKKRKKLEKGHKTQRSTSVTGAAESPSSRRRAGAAQPEGSFVGEKQNGDSVGMIAGVVLQSPMTSVLDLLPAKYKRMLVSDIFENLKRAPNVEVPVLLVHGKCDDVVPISHSHRLAAKFPFVFRLVEVEDAGHYDIETDYSDDLLDPMIDFLICLAGGDADAIERKVTPKKAAPKRYGGPEIAGWLDEINLSHLEQEFVSWGYTDPAFLCMISAEELRMMNITDTEEISIILRKVHGDEAGERMIAELQSGGSEGGDAEQSEDGEKEGGGKEDGEKEDGEKEDGEKEDGEKEDGEKEDGEEDKKIENEENTEDRSDDSHSKDKSMNGQDTHVGSTGNMTDSVPEGMPITADLLSPKNSTTLTMSESTTIREPGTEDSFSSEHETTPTQSGNSLLLVDGKSQKSLSSRSPRFALKLSEKSDENFTASPRSEDITLCDSSFDKELHGSPKTPMKSVKIFPSDTPEKRGPSDLKETHFLKTNSRMKSPRNQLSGGEVDSKMKTYLQSTHSRMSMRMSLLGARIEKDPSGPPPAPDPRQLQPAAAKKSSKTKDNQRSPRASADNSTGSRFKRTSSEVFSKLIVSPRTKHKKDEAELDERNSGVDRKGSGLDKERQDDKDRDKDGNSTDYFKRQKEMQVKQMQNMQSNVEENAKKPEPASTERESQQSSHESTITSPTEQQDYFKKQLEIQRKQLQLQLKAKSAANVHVPSRPVSAMSALDLSPRSSEVEKKDAQRRASAYEEKKVTRQEKDDRIGKYKKKKLDTTTSTEPSIHEQNTSPEDPVSSPKDGAKKKSRGKKRRIKMEGESDSVSKEKEKMRIRACKSEAGSRNKGVGKGPGKDAAGGKTNKELDLAAAKKQEYKNKRRAASSVEKDSVKEAEKSEKKVKSETAELTERKQKSEKEESERKGNSEKPAKEDEKDSKVKGENLEKSGEVEEGE